MLFALALGMFGFSSQAFSSDSSKVPQLRLPGIAKPERYSVELTIVPTSATFTGVAEIDMEFQQDTTFLWLNANDLKVKEVSLQQGKDLISAHATQSQPDYVKLDFDHPVHSGKARLHVSYSGILNTIDNSAVFKEKEGGDWYVFTFFEPRNARRAFPCFDEPSYKVPWQLTLHVPKEDVAVSNTNAVSEAAEKDGMKKVVVAETKPLPSYLVAFAVGPFEIVDAGKAGKNHTLLRIITPRGKSSQARYAVATCPQIFSLLEDYFGIPYPYEKLDQIAVPQTGFAMENPGLITYWQTGLLAPPEQETFLWKRSYASVNAHEMAHQWFGDLVTMSWWDEIWLNESFASWMSTRIENQWKPEWKIQTSNMSSLQRAMSGDSLVSARKIRQPITTNDDIENYVDAITYDKGESILYMFEKWIGEEKFQRGVQRYLKAHAWGNATTEDFLAALSAEVGFDIAPAFNSFLDQGGVPLVSAELICGEKGAKLRMYQQRYLPIGSEGTPVQIWQIPVCVRYVIGSSADQKCTLLKETEADFPLSQSGSCPDWVLGNAGETGYYHVRYQNDLLNGLLQKGMSALTTRERLGLLTDLYAMAKNGSLPTAKVLSAIPAFLQDSDSHVLTATLDVVAAIDPYLVPHDLQPNYQRFIRKLYG